MSQFLATSLVRDVPDFPKPGIVFKDLCPVVANPSAYQEIVDALVEWIAEKAPDAVIGIESRGFIFGGQTLAGPGEETSRAPCRCTRKRRARPRARKSSRLRDVNC